MIKNYMEVLLDNAFKTLLKDKKSEFSCTCEDCIDNISAIALNNIKPFYVTSKTGEVFGAYRTFETQNKCDIISEIYKAKEIVEKKPKHSAK